MHLAHKQLFKRLDNNGGIIVIQTSYANLTPYMSREKHTDYPIYFYPLENIKHLSGKQFIKLLQEEFPSMKKIVVGYDFHFGNQAAYNTKNLIAFFDGDVEIIDEYKVDNISVHSRVIRSLLRDGDIESANKLLGYNYQLTGLVIKGQGLGKKQFVPTLNLNVKNFLIPQEGVYLTKSKLNDIEYSSVSFIGHRVTTDGKFAVETHLLDSEFTQEIPKNVDLEFIKKVRDNRKFDTFEDLKKQINDDINYCKNWIKGN